MINPCSCLHRALKTVSCRHLGHPLSTNVKRASRSVVSDSLQPHGLYSAWNSPGQNTGVDSHIAHGNPFQYSCLENPKDGGV